MIYLFCFLSYECSVYTVLINKCINENIAVLNNEIMSFKMGSKGPLSLKTNPQSAGYELFIEYSIHGYEKVFFVIFDVGASKEALKDL